MSKFTVYALPYNKEEKCQKKSKAKFGLYHIPKGRAKLNINRKGNLQTIFEVHVEIVFTLAEPLLWSKYITRYIGKFSVHVEIVFTLAEPLLWSKYITRYIGKFSLVKLERKMCQLKHGPLVYAFSHSSMIHTMNRVFLFGRDVISWHVPQRGEGF